PDRGGGGSLPRAGSAEQQRGKILHPAPKIAVVKPYLLGEDILPKVAAQFLHTGALTNQPAHDEVIRAAQLIEDGEEPGGFLRAKSALPHFFERINGELHVDRLRSDAHLLDDQLIEVLVKDMEQLKEKSGLHQLAVAPGKAAQVRQSLIFQFL